MFSSLSRHDRFVGSGATAIQVWDEVAYRRDGFPSNRDAIVKKLCTLRD
jgi:hypothetical protein